MSNFRIALRCNVTGAIRMIKGHGDWDESAEYIWTEGNYACDCNRAILFAAAAGDPNPERQCGDTAFTALFAELPDRIIRLEE